MAISSAYSVYHHARPARERPPASSAAYQLFSAVHDLATAGLYGVGAMVVHQQGAGWSALIGGGDDAAKGLLAQQYLVPAEQYALIAAGGLHVASLGAATYLAVMFHRIARMPPDLNPLEDHLTRRAHKRNKSSIATNGTWESLSSENSSTARISARLEQHRRSGAPYEDLARPPSIPFMHTRSGSRDSFASGSGSASGSNPGSPKSAKRDSRSDLPSRQYQILPANAPSPSRHSVPPVPSSSASAASVGGNSTANNKRMSAPPLASSQKQTQTQDRGRDLLGVPGQQAEASPLEPLTPRPLSAASVQTADYSRNNASPTRAEPPRPPRFTETWYASESLVNRTHERQRALDREERRLRRERDSRAYEALAQPYDDDDDDIDDDDDDDLMGSDRENSMIRPRGGAGDLSASDYELSDDEDEDETMLPHPLRAHPPAKQEKFDANLNANANLGSRTRPRAKAPLHLSNGVGAALSDVNLNSRAASGSRDIADAGNNNSNGNSLNTSTGGWKGRNRDSSIQPEEGLFYSRPYGDLKPATPPVMVGGSGGAGVRSGARQVSSGTDYYDLGSSASTNPVTYRRNVSGKIAEEGLAGPAYASSRLKPQPQPQRGLLKALVA